MTLTINTVDGKSIRMSASASEYGEIIDTIQNESFLYGKTGDVLHIIATEHITSIAVSE